MNELVSIVVPVYRVEEYLDECINSIINQTYNYIEIILVDDGSPDKCPEICDNYAKNDKRIKVIHKENGGLSDARNFGIPHATGEYIAFLDSDDYVEPNTYKTMYEKAVQENSDYVECDFIWEYPDKSNIDTRDYYFGKREMLEKVRVVAWNKLIKRDIIVNNNIKFPFGLRY